VGARQHLSSADQGSRIRRARTQLSCSSDSARRRSHHKRVVQAKIEHPPANKITANDLGLAHVQRTRAEGEFTASGYTVRGRVATHMIELSRDAILVLWLRISALLSGYRAAWSFDDLAVRRIVCRTDHEPADAGARAASALRPMLPRTGWLVRAFATGNPLATADALTPDWRPR